MLEQRQSERVKLGYKQVGVIRVDEIRMQESHPGFATATQSHPHPQHRSVKRAPLSPGDLSLFGGENKASEGF